MCERPVQVLVIVSVSERPYEQLETLKRAMQRIMPFYLDTWAVAIYDFPSTLEQSAHINRPGVSSEIVIEYLKTERYDQRVVFNSELWS